MKVYNTNNNKVEFLGKTLSINGANLYVHKLSESELNTYGYFLVIDDEPLYDAETQYIEPSDIDLVENRYIQRYDVLDIPYDVLRQKAYPLIYDYLDAVVHGDNDAIKKYIDECRAVKLRYPKPEAED